MAKLSTVPGLNNIFYAYAGEVMLENEIVEEREKAIKVKTQAYLCSPGTCDKTGTEKGFAWIPKSALINYKGKPGEYTIAGWCNLQFRIK